MISPPADWQSVLAESVRSPAELCRLLGLPPRLAAEAQRAADGWPMLVPRPYLARIRPSDPADPLLRQVLPQAAELAAVAGYTADPLGEAGARCGPGLLRKYQGRILMVTTPSCGVHCRFCFRRHFPYEASSPAAADWGPAVREIAADPSIHEVILSGGDPLMLPDSELAGLAGRLAAIPHLRRLRIHTRLPVVVPQRVTGGLISAIRGAAENGPLSSRERVRVRAVPSSPLPLPLSQRERGDAAPVSQRARGDRSRRLAVIVVVHVNHPAEIDADVADAFGRLLDAGIPLLSQSVLLRGVNDRADVLCELFERLVDLRVIPYYLHQLDPVAGAAHFAVPIATGIALVAELRARLPGYAVPRYVRETPGGSSKEVLA